MRIRACTLSVRACTARERNAMVRSTLLLTGVAAAFVLTATSARAASSVGSVTPTKANGSMIPGSGIPSDNFTINTAATGESVALKARDRNNGQAISVTGTRSLLPAGMATATRAAWNFDFQFSPGEGSAALPGAYTYELQVDTNPAYGTATFQTINVPSVID